MPARPKIIDLTPPGHSPQSFIILRRERNDGRNPQYYARRTIPARLRKTPRNPYIMKALGPVSLERAKELAWQWWTSTERKILHEEPLLEKPFSNIAESYLLDLEGKTRITDDRDKPLVNPKKYARHRQSIRIHLNPYFGSMPISGIRQNDVERWLEQRRLPRTKRPGEGQGQDQNATKPKRWSVPAHSTVQKDAVAFAAVVRHARLHFKVDTRFVPDLPLPEKTEDTRRPRFYPEEWRRISEALYERANTRIGKSGPLSENSIWFRTMLFFFVTTLHGTGLRVAEAARLKVKHLKRVAEDMGRRSAFQEQLRSGIRFEESLSESDREAIIAETVAKLYDYRVEIASDNGLKHYTHRRIVIPSLDMAPRFDQLLHHLLILPQTIIGEISRPEELPTETWLFCHLDGRRINSFNHGFDEVLRSLCLLYHDGKKRSLTSLRHTYASERIEARAADLKSIADNMGTTVEMLYRHYAQEIRELRAADLQAV